MGSIWVREFTGGLDTRRMPETTPGGALILGEDGHVTRGGEFEKRAAFVKAYDLPEGVTVGLAADTEGLVVFGKQEAIPPFPGVITPDGVRYQALPASEYGDLIDVPSTDMFGGKLYVAARYEGGNVIHFYDGERVPAWVDGKASASFAIANAPGTAKAAGSFRVSLVGPADSIDNIKIDDVEIIPAPITGITGVTDMAAAIAAAINGMTSDPDYTAIASADGTVTITAVEYGADVNGKDVAVTQTGISIIEKKAMAGGLDPTKVSSISVGDVELLAAPVVRTAGMPAFRTAIIDAINSGPASATYLATLRGVTTIVITAKTAGVEPNGLAVVFDANNGFKTTPEDVEMHGGTGGTLYQPGAFVRTIGTKEYSLSGPNMYFSGIKDPLNWTSDAVGGGFIDMSTESSGSEELVAVERYQNYVAVFAAETVQIWYVDPDPTLNRVSQVLSNTGTMFPRTVTQFGDNDLFYLHRSGVRSLRARDASNAAATTDIGVLVDSVIRAKVESLPSGNRSRAVFGLIEPDEGRFWLIVRNVIYVFSFFTGSKVSAWTRYNCVADGEAFNVEAVARFDGKVYLRSGDSIYVYGGLDEGLVYDTTQAVAQLPYLNADKPAQEKQWKGYDAALTGTWDLEVLLLPARPDVSQPVTTLTETSFDAGALAGIGRSTHISARLKSRGAGPAKLSSLVILYESETDED